MLAVSLVSCIVTASDKRRAVKNKRRIPEKTLFLLAAAGGSAAMYITMNIIRHKTKHKRFMIGLPLIIFAQCAIAVLIFLWYNKLLPFA